jgi:hypothetical protein
MCAVVTVLQLLGSIEFEKAITIFSPLPLVYPLHLDMDQLERDIYASINNAHGFPGVRSSNELNIDTQCH